MDLNSTSPVFSSITIFSEFKFSSGFINLARSYQKLPIPYKYETFFFQKGQKMLPFLKDRHEGGMSGPVEIKVRESDSPEDEDAYSMIDAVAEDMIEAIHKKDKRLLKDALDALVQHIQENDELQDEEDME